MTKPVSFSFLFMEIRHFDNCPTQLHSLLFFMEEPSEGARRLVEVHWRCWIVEAENHIFFPFLHLPLLCLLNNPKPAFGNRSRVCEFISVLTFCSLWSSCLNLVSKINMNVTLRGLMIAVVKGRFLGQSQSKGLLPILKSVSLSYLFKDEGWFFF